MIPKGLLLQNPLWDYALSVYPRLSQPLLELQACGARVNQLLAALWCTDTGRVWPGAIPDPIERWHTEEVLPIRKRRMALKPLLSEYPQLEGLYGSYKQVELNCERVELAMLYQWLESVRSGNEISYAHNLAAVVNLNGSEPQRYEITDLLSAVDQL